MKKATDTKYLIKQRRVWYFRYIIPDRYAYAYPQKEYKRTTQEEHLDRAIEVRDILLMKLRYEFKQIDTGVKASIPEIAKKHLRELTEYKQAKSAPDATETDRLGLDELIYEKQRDIVDDASIKFIPRGTSQEEINKNAYEIDPQTSERISDQQDQIEALRNLDKTGRGIQFIKDATGERFNAYVQEYIKKKTDDGEDKKKTNSYRNSINEFSDKVKVENLNKKSVRKYGRDRVLNENLQPQTVITKTQFLNDYLKFVAEDIEASWANILTPFPLNKRDLPKDNNTGKDRQAWSMEDMKLVYQADTPQVKNKPELKDLMVLGMIYGCRIEELLQLTIANIMNEENIRCIFIDKSKTDGYHPFGQRHLPIVDCLNPIIDRLIEGKEQDAYLIATTSSPNQDRSALIGGTFNRHKEPLGFPRPKTRNFGGKPQTVKDFHSYRKVVNTNLTLLGLKTNQRESICGWGTAFQSKQMAETAYLDNKMAYPLVQRKEHLEQWASQFTFSF